MTAEELAERQRALRDEILRRRHERDHGTVYLFEYFDPASYARIPAPEDLRGRQIVRICLPPSPHAGALTPALGLYRCEPRGLVHLASPIVEVAP